MACQVALPWMVAVALLLALAAQPVQAQIYKLEQAPVPAPLSLSTHYVFYVKAQANGAQASVEFRQLAAHKTPDGQQPPSGYKGLQVSILPLDKFWDLVNKESFCASTQDVKSHKAKQCCHLLLNPPAGSTLDEVGVRTQGVPLGSEAETVSFPIKNAGRYILTISNCGNYSEATITGSVAVRNAHGYLPAYEFNAMRNAGWSMVLYTGICLAWTSAVVRYYKSLFYVQKGILVISLICVLEAFSTWLDRWDWNTTGARRDSLFIASLFFYTVKYVVSWRLLLLTALGGAVLEDLDTKTAIIFFLSSFLFLLQLCAWRLIISYRFSHELDSTFLLLVTLPGILIYGGMFGWAFRLLTSLSARIAEQKRDDLMGILGKTRKILVVGFLLSTINATVQILDIAKNIFPWDLAWFSVDGAPQYSFMAVLVAMMVVWWPTEDSWKYGYQVQTNVAEDEEDADVNHIQLDASKPKAEKANMVAPEAIGAPEKEMPEGEDGENLL
mmetsp:Transcript_100115/g.291996  ORF Transcript_100115/g.291996 Transcript_100115/m.291996 type:complete len:499 (+) Transcript_100115:86-1582(+)